jgi:hypothetical protein
VPALEFPRHHLGLLLELATHLLEHRKAKTELDSLARELLSGFFDVCLRSGLDGLLVALAEVNPGLDPTERSSLQDHEELRAKLVAQLQSIDLDGGGPRAAKPKQVADCAFAALGLTVVDETDRTLALDAAVRVQALAAITSVVDPQLAAPRVRETIIEKARVLCAEGYHAAFDKLATHLDERGQRLVRQPKVPIDALHAVQRALGQARDAVVEQAARAGIEAVKVVLARADAAAAARFDEPITLKLTPRDVAVIRTLDPRLPKVTSAVAVTLLDGLVETSRLTWRAPEKTSRAYGASQTFAVGELLDHPKFGRGTVTGVMGQRIDVEFETGKVTLVHKPK